MKIRKAATTDAYEVARLQVVTWKSAYAGIISQEYLDAMSIEKCAKGWLSGISKVDCLPVTGHNHQVDFPDREVSHGIGEKAQI